MHYWFLIKTIIIITIIIIIIIIKLIKPFSGHYMLGLKVAN